LSTTPEASDLRRTPFQPPEDITHGLFATSRHIVRARPLATDALLAAVLLVLSTVWLAGSRFAGLHAAVLQAALIVPIAFRRARPSAVFVLVSGIAVVQWLFGPPLIGDCALLIALYTVAAHESLARALIAAGVMEAGAVMAALRWAAPAGTAPRSFLFLTATVVAALFAGLTAASGSRYLAWLDERAHRLEVERDQQGTIAAAAERTRIARELHDIVSHSLSVVITLADAAALVSRADPDRGAEAMAEVSEIGRIALSDMRAMLGLLRTEEPVELAPQPGTMQLRELAERVQATGLAVDIAVEGAAFPLGAAAELTIYRIVQEALTNTLRHASARRAVVTIGYHAPTVDVQVIDDGTASSPDGHRGHGIDGMRERAALYGGVLRAGPLPDGGWSVSATLHPGQAAAPPAPVPG
jgi:signal transduction histidine kinase